MRSVSPPLSALGWIHLLKAFIFLEASLLSCCSGVIDTLGEPGDERERVKGNME